VRDKVGTACIEAVQLLRGPSSRQPGFVATDLEAKLIEVSTPSTNTKFMMEITTMI
jgi:hypothetical protein